MYTDIILVKQDRLLNTSSTMNLRFYCRLRYELFIKISYYLFFMSLICFCAVLMIMHQLFSRFFYSLFFAFLRERERKRGQFLKGTGIQRNPGVAVFISLFSCYSCISLSVPSSSKNKNLT